MDCIKLRQIKQAGANECFGINWMPELLRSDALITPAYYAISFAPACFVRRRNDLKFNWIYFQFEKENIS